MATLAAYWSGDELITNGLIFLHLLGALLVGMMMGYERSFHGRAAGMRTYALVCLASTLLTVMSGFPKEWYGGLVPVAAVADPTRIVQGVMTGIGFLGAGVIMKEGMTIRGLSTAASVWITAAVGVAIGMGFYGAAIAAALMVMLVMSGLRHLEVLLPHQTELHLTLAFARANAPRLEHLQEQLCRHQMVLTGWSYHHGQGEQPVEFQLTLRSNHPNAAEMLAHELTGRPDIWDFSISPGRS